jgi:hypothetical protein
MDPNDSPAGLQTLVPLTLLAAIIVGVSLSCPVPEGVVWLILSPPFLSVALPHAAGFVWLKWTKETQNKLVIELKLPYFADIIFGELMASLNCYPSHEPRPSKAVLLRGKSALRTAAGD